MRTERQGKTPGGGVGQRLQDDRRRRMIESTEGVEKVSRQEASKEAARARSQCEKVTGGVTRNERGLVL